MESSDLEEETGLETPIHRGDRRGGEFWFGMAVVIMSGLAVRKMLTLGFVPVLYSLMFRRGGLAGSAAG